MGRVLSGPVVAAVGDDPRLVVAGAACEGDLGTRGPGGLELLEVLLELLSWGMG